MAPNGINVLVVNRGWRDHVVERRAATRSCFDPMSESADARLPVRPSGRVAFKLSEKAWKFSGGSPILSVYSVHLAPIWGQNCPSGATLRATDLANHKAFGPWRRRQVRKHTNVCDPEIVGLAFLAH